MGAGFKARAIRAFSRVRGLLAWLFLEQLIVVQHPSRFKAVLTPRRAGKSEMAVAWIFDEALKHPGEKFLYVALTRPNAKDIAWGVFKKLFLKFDLGDVNECFHESALEIYLPNGSIVMLRGADQAHWAEKLEGQEFRLIVVDEAAQFNISLRKIVYGSFGPMTMKGGTICLVSRPGDVKMGLFYDLTCEENRQGPKDSGGGWEVFDKKGAEHWEVFNWSTFDNPFMSEWHKAEVERKVRNNPAIVNQPLFRRHYFGEWAEDADTNVYAFDENRNVIEEWMQLEGDRFGMITDFGWTDSQGFLVGCWGPRRPDYVVVESFKQSQMPLKDALERMAQYQARYPGMLMWGDPARKQLYMEMAIRFGEGAVVNPAQKTEKQDHQLVLNNDMLLGRIKIVRGTNGQLIDELKKLKKLVKEDGTWVDHPKQPNDLCDCLLYGWRHSMHFRYKEVMPGPEPGTPEHADAMMQEVWKQEAEKIKKAERKASWRRR